jgi:hypothetical protein
VKPQVFVATALVLTGLGAAGLRFLKGAMRFSAPAVRMTSLPLVSETGNLARTNSVALPASLPGYRSEVLPLTELELGYLPADTEFGRRRYQSVSDSFGFAANVVLMGADRTSLHRPEYCLPGQGWQIVKKSFVNLPIPGRPAGDLPVQRFDLKGEFDFQGQKIKRNGVYLFVFLAEGRQTPSHYTRQWLMIQDVLTRGTVPRWAYVSFFTDCTPGTEEATYERLAQATVAAVPKFEVGTGTVTASR